ncbi:SAM-dependent methyltransferase [Sorangium sp. So ce117]|uniref:SAM-dependent methyltransferase n=1 Tax=Sorangium sp. So ce117 TaxID=3133277 RepID=UPI003F61D7D6
MPWPLAQDREEPTPRQVERAACTPWHAPICPDARGVGGTPVLPRALWRATSFGDFTTRSTLEAPAARARPSLWRRKPSGARGGSVCSGLRPEGSAPTLGVRFAIAPASRARGLSQNIAGARKQERAPVRVYMIGACPGDRGLITVHGAEFVARCPVVMCTGSPVPQPVAASARPDAWVIDSSGMILDLSIAVFVEARNARHDVTRVHTGDPVLFGSTTEQMRRMDKLGMPYELIPGVSLFTASALEREVTLPGRGWLIISSAAPRCGATSAAAGPRGDERRTRRALWRSDASNACSITCTPTGWAPGTHATTHPK